MRFQEGLFDEDAIWQEGVVLKYFSDLFKSSYPLDFAELLEVIVPKVSTDMNERLTGDFQGIEVHKALKQMYPLKSPSPDDIPPLFFQHFWPAIGSVVTKTILDFLNLGTIPPKFNETLIVLSCVWIEMKTSASAFCLVFFFFFFSLVFELFECCGYCSYPVQ